MASLVKSLAEKSLKVNCVNFSHLAHTGVNFSPMQCLRYKLQCHWLGIFHVNAECRPSQAKMQAQSSCQKVTNMPHPNRRFLAKSAV